MNITRNHQGSLVRGVGICLMLAGGCASTTYSGPSASESRVSGALQQPFRDVSWMREEPPEVLKSAVLDPYRLADEAQCDQFFSEIATLDLLLGPDVDAYDVNDGSAADAGGLAADAVASFVGLPFRGVFRWLSGAEKREKVLADAILSGMARRAFLKGAARKTGCTPPHVPEPELGSR